ncbi:hypothetical protein ACS5PK_22125 [Roseateles sp. DB2]|uniref:hypothetical protein n=1 Tax=Roseateles sp. DB2 TaxID=3453717 RepID=UPI003EE8FAD7
MVKMDSRIEDGREGHELPKKTLVDRISQLKALWALLGGGALVGFTGSAILYLYLWRIGGIPVGQMAAIGGYSKVVFPAALFLAAVVLLIWLSPAWMALSFSTDADFDKSFRRIFENRSDADVESLSGSSEIAATAPPSDQGARKWAVNRQRVFVYSLSTLGIFCIWPILLALQSKLLIPNGHINWLGWASLGSLLGLSVLLQRLIWTRAGPNMGPWLPLSHKIARFLFRDFVPMVLRQVGRSRKFRWRLLAPMRQGFALRVRPLTAERLFVAGLAVVLWPIDMRGSAWRWVTMRAASTERKSPAAVQESFALVCIFGIGSALVSLSPFALMLLLLQRSDLLLNDPSGIALSGAMALIGLGLSFAFAFSLAGFLGRVRNEPWRWGMVTLGNATLLLLLIFALGATDRLLDGIMSMSSVRIENAVLFVEQDGCDLLKSMSSSGDAGGWAPAPSADSKSCLLYNVTVESSLEPAMQIACWRGGAPSHSGRASEASPPNSQADTSAQASAKAPSTPASDSKPAVERGKLGSFSMPTKYIRNVWKLGFTPRGFSMPVCPQSDVRLIDASEHKSGE